MSMRSARRHAAGAIVALALWVAGCAGQSGNPPPKVDASPYLAELQRLPVLGGGWIEEALPG